MSSTSETIQSLSGFVWSIAETLRGRFKQSEYGKVILPFVVLRRLDCLLQDSKGDVLNAAGSIPDSADQATRDMILFGAVGGNIKVYNLSRFTFESLRGQEPGQLHQNLIDYITKFSPTVQEMFLERFLFTDQLKRLNDKGVLWSVFDRFCQIDLHPNSISSLEMGYLFEELIRRFSEISNETAGEHFTPREVIRLIVDLLIANDDAKLTGRGIIRQVYDPACGTGGMLALTEEALKDFNPSVRVELFGQEINDESYAICRSDMLITGHNPENVAPESTLAKDAHAGKRFHYMLSNPPYGVDWKDDQAAVKEEAASLGHEGRFGAGTPKISAGQLLFLQHMISKMRDDEDGSRIGIVMNGSPLFSGAAKSGESEIRRWMLENDWVEAIIALPTDLFYNTGIQTYVWLLTNRKPTNRRGKVQLIDASGEEFWVGMRKSLGKKRREIPESARNQIVDIYSKFIHEGDGETSYSKIFSTQDFAYREIRIERPLRLNFRVSDDRLQRLKELKAFTKLDAEKAGEILDAVISVGDELFLNREDFAKRLDAALRTKKVKVGLPLKRALMSSLSERDQSADICRDKNGEPEPDTDLRDYEIVPFSEDWQDFFEREVSPFVADAWVDQSYTDEDDRAVGRIGYEINFRRYFFEYQEPRPLAEIDNDLKNLEKSVRSSLMELVS